MTRNVTIANDLYMSYMISKEYISFGFSGPKDTVRLASRDAILGLRIPQGNDREEVGMFEHTSEMIKVKGMSANRKNNGHETITIKIATKEHKRLIVMFRYLNQLGVPAYVSQNYDLDSTNFFYILGERYYSSTLSYYLDNLAKEAEKDTTPLVINDYKLPASRCFWLTSEIRAEQKEQFTEYNKSLINLSFLTQTTNNVELQKQQINLRISNIISLVEILLRQHPNVPMPNSSTYARGELYTYCRIKEQFKDQETFDRVFKEHLPLVRQECKDNFILLADKYHHLTNKLKALNKAEVVEENQSVSSYCNII